MFTTPARRTVLMIAAAAALLLSCSDDAAEPQASVPDTSTGAAPITVQQLLERSADTPIAVQGFLYADGTSVRLCDAVLESYPPQCGGAAVELSGLDVSTVDGTTTEGSITWREGAVLLVQYSPDGSFTVLEVVR